MSKHHSPRSGSVAASLGWIFPFFGHSSIAGVRGKGRRLEFDWLEERVLLATKPIEIRIGDLGKENFIEDNITLFNSDTSTMPATQAIQGQLFNAEVGKTYELSLDPAKGGGQVTFSPSSVKVEKVGDCPKFTITPTKESGSALDVHIVAKLDGKKVATTTMTVVRVNFKKQIYSANTPKEMLLQQAFRITPNRSKNLNVTVMPDLKGEHGDNVELVAFTPSHAGEFTIDGGERRTISSGNRVQVSLLGTERTLAGSGGELFIQIEVRKQRVEGARSTGFSVTAIPNGMSIGGDAFHIENGTRVRNPVEGIGFDRRMIPRSDSGNIADLQDIYLAEWVDTIGFTSNGVYATNDGFDASRHEYHDLHNINLFKLTLPSKAGVLGGLFKTGHEEVHQIYTFWDQVTGARNIPVANSGFVITRNWVIYDDGTASGSVEKRGQAVSTVFLGLGFASSGPGLNSLFASMSRFRPPAHMPVPGGLISSSESATIQSEPSANWPMGNALIEPAATVSPAYVAGRWQVGSPPDAKPNAGFTLAVQAVDAHGNMDTTFNGTVTLSLKDNPGGASLSGTKTLQATNGFAIFSGMSIDKVGTGYTLQATGSGLATGTSAAFNVATQQLSFTTQPPTNLVAGTTFGCAVKVLNSNGTTDTTFNGPITLTNSTLTGNRTVQAINGVATFSGLSLINEGFQVVTATALGLVRGSSNVITVTNTASKLVVWRQPPSMATATAGFSLAVAAVNSLGVIDRDFTGTVTLALANNPGGAALGGTTTATFVDGIASFDATTLSKAGTGYTLSATCAGLTAAATNAFNVTAPGKATQLAVKTPPPGTVAGNTQFGLVIAAQDDLGTVDTTFNGLVTLAIEDHNAATDPTLGGTLTVQAVNGLATFTGLTLDALGYYSLSASASSLPATRSDFFQVTAAAATGLVVAELTENVLAGKPFGVAVHAVDAQGNLDLTFNGSVTLGLSPSSALGPLAATLSGTMTVNAVAGVANFFDLTISQPTGELVLQASADGLAAGLSATFQAASHQLVITSQPPSTVIAGNGFGLTVSATNAAGNIDTSFSGNITVSGTFGDVQGTTTVQAVNGVATFSGLTLNVPGNLHQLLVTAAGAASATTDTFNVKAQATRLALTAEPPLAVTAGAGFNVTVAAVDALGNVDSSFQGSVTLSLGNNPAGGTLSGTLVGTAVNGIATFSGLKINNVGAGYTLRATASGLAQVVSSAIDVRAAGVATRLVLTTPPPSTVTAGNAFNVVVQAQDSLGAIAAAFQGTITLTDDNGNIVAQTSASQGVATFANLSLETAGATILLAGATGLVSASTEEFEVSAAAASEILVLAPFTGVLTGSPFGVNAFALDAFGNLATMFQGNADLALASNPGSATLGGTLSSAAVDGVLTFDGLSLNVSGAGYTLQATSSGLTPGVSTSFDVFGSQLTTSPLTAVKVGNAFSFPVQVKNGAGTIDTSFEGDITVSLLDANYNEAPLGGTVTLPAIDGEANFTDLRIDQAGTYTLIVTATGVAPAIFDALEVTVITPTRLSLASVPGFIGTNHDFEVVVKSVDDDGLVDTSFTGAVTIALGDNPGGAVLNGTLTVQAVAGVATFSGLAVNQPGSGVTLVASTPGLISATSAVLLADDSQPTSSVSALPAAQDSSRVTLNWSGSDTGSGVAAYEIYVSDNGGPFTQLLATDATSTVFQGAYGHSYGFFSVAIDGAGNRQDTPVTAQATISISNFTKSVTFADGIVRVGGTAAKDTITLAPTLDLKKLQVTVNGVVLSKTVLLSAIQQIRIFGRDGDDVVNITNLARPIYLEGGAGNNKLTITGNSGVDSFLLTSAAVSRNGALYDLNGIGSLTINGQAGSDTLTVESLPGIPVSFQGGGGADRLQAASGNNTFTLSTASTGKLNGTLSFATVENLAGGASQDTLVAANLANTWKVTGANAGSLGTLLFTGMENLTGGTQADLFLLAAGQGISGVLDGGAGRNTLSYAAYLTAVTVDLASGTATGTSAVSNINDVYGGAGDDVLRGNAGNNVLIGNGGNDELVGREGNDTLLGSAGADTLLGGAGRDLHFGGSGADTLEADTGDDILAGGLLTFHNETASTVNQAALNGLLAEWSRTDLAYATRIAHLRSGGGLNKTFLLTAATVRNDGVADTLLGQQELDWFLISTLDQTPDRDSLTETRTTV